MKVVSIGLLLLVLFSGSTYAGQSVGIQSPEPPRLDAWLFQERQNLTISVEFNRRKHTVYLGTLEHYFNPYNTKDRITVIKKFVSIVEPHFTEQRGDNPNFNVEVINNYTAKAYQDSLIKLYSDSAAVIYLRYSVVYDSRNNEEISDSIESWLKKRGGWVYERCKSPDKCELIKIEFVSEPRKDKKNQDGKLENGNPILVGIRYSLGEQSQVFMFDQDDLLNEKERKKIADEEKKK